MLLAFGLLSAIKIDERCTTLSGSITAVRQAIASSLDVDLSEDHLVEVLKPASPNFSARPKNAVAKEKSNEAAAEVARIAKRLNARRTVLVDTLAARVMDPHPALVLKPESAKIDSIVANRLSDQGISEAIQTWTSEAMDPRTDRAITKAGIPTKAIAVHMASMVDGKALRRSVVAVLAPQRSPFEPKGPESGWTKDVNARLIWALTALIFCLAFGFVLVTTVNQILYVEWDDRIWFVIALAAAIVIALRLPDAQPSLQATPLHEALDYYAKLFGLGILDWVDWFDRIRKIGIVLLIAGSVATFAVACEHKLDLEQQLRSFKSLFNAGAVFLFAGVLELYARYRWPLTFVTDASAQEQLQSTAAMVAATAGALFSVVLLVAYVSTTFVIRRQAIEHDVDRDQVDEALKNAGFGDSFSAQLMRFAQALVPLLPGVVTLFGTGIQ